MPKKTQETSELNTELESTQEVQEAESTQESTQAQASQESSQESSEADSTPPSTPSISETNKRINAALDSSTEWKEQIRITLQSIQEVYLAFVALDESYQTSLSALSAAQNALESSTKATDTLASDIAKAIMNAKKDFEKMQERAQATLSEAQETAQSTATNAKTTNDNLVAIEAIYDKVRTLGNTIIEKEAVIIEAFEKWKALDSLLQKGEVLKAELDTKLESHRSQLNQDKEGYEDELEQKKNEITADFENLSRGKISALETLSETKNNALTTRIDNLNTELEAHRLRIQTASDTLNTSYDKIKEEITQSLADYLSRARDSEAPYFYTHASITAQPKLNAFLACQVARAIQKYALLHKGAKIQVDITSESTPSTTQKQIISYNELYELEKTKWQKEQENAEQEAQEATQEAQASQEASQESSQEASQESSEAESTTPAQKETFPDFEGWLSKRYNEMNITQLKAHTKLFPLPAEMNNITFSAPLNENSTMREAIEVLLSEEQKAQQANKQLEFIDTLIASYEQNEAAKLTKYAVS